MFRASQCSSSGDRVVLIHHLVWLVLWPLGMPIRREQISLLTGIPSSRRFPLILISVKLVSYPPPSTCRFQLKFGSLKCTVNLQYHRKSRKFCGATGIMTFRGDQTGKPYEISMCLEQGHLKHVARDYTLTSTDILLRK